MAKEIMSVLVSRVGLRRDDCRLEPRNELENAVQGVSRLAPHIF